jgi:hypothetical protein
MTSAQEKAAAATAKRLALRCAYTEFLRLENQRASDDAALQFAKKAGAEKNAPLPDWSLWQIFMLITGMTTPPG